ncbi:SMI1/KNR4 family protein [Chitinophaga nivalis]|uniref:SMI1/KNR4 family protein n=1 Tax=Chitinophaga nivalis TaxID=2991709 RepID=A0ABT3IP27_9BACT|nr:SMI1/KNR4 family protein [Chitinophaga nivalis]MCW3464578.1 SMI1/KNR4 family protein [Chitinophaga nivalis]MCW3485731.1 SMI1/KNR4 family protein [Chitinophaga nivalis]
MENLLNAYEDFFGKPDLLVTLPATKKNSTFQVGVNQSEIDDESNTITSLGLSVLEGEKEWDIEFSIEVMGAVSEQKALETGNFYYQLFNKVIAGEELVSGSIYKQITLPGFDRMKHLLIMDKGYLSAQWLDDEQATGRLINVIALFEQEADQLQQLVPELREKIIWRSDIVFADPAREPENIVYQAMLNTWSGIAEWFQENGVHTADDLNRQLEAAGSEAPATALEKELGFTLPLDFKASFNIQQEGISLGTYDMFDAEGIIQERNDMNRLNKAGTFDKMTKNMSGDPRIKKVGWHEKWVPIAMNSAGDTVCIDMDPGPEGVPGQIIIRLMEQGPIATDYTSFFDWLDAFDTDLKGDSFEVDSDGFLHRKEDSL